MGKIGDLFVRLGLKSDDYKKGINDAKKQTDSFGDKLGKMKTAAVAVWAAIGATIVKVAKDTIAATNQMGDVWAQNMAKVKASYRSVLAQLSTNNKREKGWWLRLFNPNDTAGAEVGANAKAAGDAAKKMAEAFDAEFELVNSVKLQRAAIQQELNQLYVDMRDTTLSPSARKAAMDRYKALLEPIANAEVAVYQNMLNTAVEAWQAGNMDILSRQYSAAELTDFFSMYGTDAAGARAKYGELASVYETRQNDEFNALIVETILKLRSAQNEMSQIDKEMGRVATSIKKALNPDVIIEGLEELDEELIELDLEIPPIDTSNLDKAFAEIQANAEKYREELAIVEQSASIFKDAIQSAMGDGLQSITDMMFGLENANMSNVAAALLMPFGNMAKQMGALIMSYGLSMDAFKKAFEVPQAAVAAGAGLMAIGAAITSGARKISEGNLSTGGTGTSYGGSSVGNATQNYESTLTIEVVGKISGNDINIAGKKAANSRNR